MVCRLTWASNKHVYKRQSGMCLPGVGVFPASSAVSFSGVGVAKVSSVLLGLGFLCSGGGFVFRCVGCLPALPSSLRSDEAKRKGLGHINFFTHPYPPDFPGSANASPTESLVSDVVLVVI